MRAAARPLLPALGLTVAVGVALCARLLVAGGTGAAAESMPAAVVFAAVLLAAGVAAAPRRSLAARTVLHSRAMRSAVLGVAGGAALVVLALLLPGLPLHLWPRPSGAAAPLWTLLVAAVATAEELIFRGVLFDALHRIAGATSAAVACAIGFALLHVPLYGWRALPLDAGAGLWLGGLRLLSGGVAAPAIAHTVADCGAWLVL